MIRALSVRIIQAGQKVTLLANEISGDLPYTFSSLPPIVKLWDYIFFSILSSKFMILWVLINLHQYIPLSLCKALLSFYLIIFFILHALCLCISANILLLSRWRFERILWCCGTEPKIKAQVDYLASEEIKSTVVHEGFWIPYATLYRGLGSCGKENLLI